MLPLMPEVLSRRRCARGEVCQFVEMDSAEATRVAGQAAERDRTRTDERRGPTCEISHDLRQSTRRSSVVGDQLFGSDKRGLLRTQTSATKSAHSYMAVRVRGLLSGGAARKRAASRRAEKLRPTVLERLEGSVLETVSIRNAPSPLQNGPPPGPLPTTH